jgi:hypothetical protein
MYLWQDNAFLHIEKKVIGNPSHMLLPYNFSNQNTLHMYLQHNCSHMLSHKHQNISVAR